MLLSYLRERFGTEEAKILLKLLETYHRSVLTAKKLNNIAIMYCHKNEYGDLLHSKMENLKNIQYVLA